MPKFPLIGPSYSSQSVNADCQQTMNLYPELIESNMGNNNIVLYPSPGTKQFVDLSPPAPPVYLAPVFYTTVTVPRSGIQVGNTLTGTYSGGDEVQIGDLVLWSFYMLLVPNLATMAALTVSYLGNPVGTFSLIDTVNFSSGLTKSALVSFWATSLLHIPAGGTLNYVQTLTGPAANSDYIVNWSGFHNVGALDQFSGQAFTGATTFNAPFINTTTPGLVLSIGKFTLNGPSVDTALPYFKFSTSVVGCNSFYKGTDPLSTNLLAPIGSYQSPWTSNSGAQDAGVINCAFHGVTS